MSSNSSLDRPIHGIKREGMTSFMYSMHCVTVVGMFELQCSTVWSERGAWHDSWASGRRTATAAELASITTLLPSSAASSDGELLLSTSVAVLTSCRLVQLEHQWYSTNCSSSQRGLLVRAEWIT